MGLMDLFFTNIVLGAVDRISKGIKKHPAFLKFSSGDSKMIAEYKDFECTIIASALTVIALNMNLKDPKQLKEIQTVYIGKSANFIRKIMSREYKCEYWKINENKAKLFYRNNIESMLCNEVHAKFDEYLTEIKDGLNSNSAFYFLKYSEPEINENTGEETFGYYRLHDFIWNLLLAEEEEDYTTNLSSILIGKKNYLDLNNLETSYLVQFAKDIQTFIEQ